MLMPGFVCMATQLETESLSPGILEISCQNYTRTNLYCFINLNCYSTNKGLQEWRFMLSFSREKKNNEGPTITLSWSIFTPR